MKKNYFSLLLVTLVGIFFITACKKKSDNGPTEASLLTSKQWTISKVIDDTNAGADVTISFTGKTAQFNSDNTYTHNIGTATESGTYTFGSGTIALALSTGTPYATALTSVSVSATELTFKVTISSNKIGNVTYSITMN